MFKVAHYAYLHTLVTIFSKRLLSCHQFSSLIKLPIEKILPALKNKGFEQIINKLSGSNLTLLPAGNMDNLFLLVLLKDARSIIRSLSGIERDFFIYWIRRFELQNIKTILRGKSLQHPKEEIHNELTPMGTFSTLPIDELLNADNIPEILTQLEKTSYAEIARYGRKSFDQKQDVFSIETAINHQYFTGLKKQFNVLDDEDKKLLQPILGRIIDQTNLIWLLRYRLKYNLSSSHTYFLLISGGLHLNSQSLILLSQIEKLEQIYRILPYEINSLLENADSIHKIELILEKDINQVARSLLKSNSFSLTHAFSYLLLREKQLSQIHALLKGKLLHLADDEIAFAMGEKW
ncbi:MAG: V-type ATPase subunit [Pseudomonadota bacterium]